jgi:hypothetical protein
VSLRLVSTSDDRALAIRDHLLPIVRERGTLESQRGPVRLITLQIDPWVFRHWTPFNELSPAEASSPGYRHAVERQHTRPSLPYGLEVWHGVKMLSVLWADDEEAFQVVSFVRGLWEDQALQLRNCDPAASTLKLNRREVAAGWGLG